MRQMLQKVDIVLRSEALIKEIEDEAKESQVGSFKGNQHKKVVSASEDANSKKGKTSKRIAEMAGTSSATVERMKKVKTEDPELYEKIVTGEESPAGAYYKLPSVQQPKPKPKEPKEPKSPIPYVNPNEEQYQNISREDSEQSIAYENLIFNLRQLDMYIEGNKNRLTVAIRKAYQENPDLLKKSVSNMEMLTKYIQEKEEN